MKQKSIFSFFIFLKFGIFFFIILLDKGFGADQYYEACEPRDCGNGLNISFPFYIQDVQDSFCGYPGFELSCSTQGYPIIRIPNNDYVVEQIFYHNRTLRVSNAAAFSSFSNSTNCLPQIRNVTLPNGQFGSEPSTRLHLLSNCKELLPESLRIYEAIACDNMNRDGRELAMLDGDGNLDSALAACATDVVAPVEVDGNGGTNGLIDYMGLLRRGFVLFWAASDCNICERSGGRCGFNASNYHFKCYCPDRPHVWSCKSRDFIRKPPGPFSLAKNQANFFLLLCGDLIRLLSSHDKRISRMHAELTSLIISFQQVCYYLFLFFV